MDTYLMKSLKTCEEPQISLNPTMVNPRLSRSKLINDKIRLETVKKPEKIENFLNSECKTKALQFFLKELELRLGYKIPQDSLENVAKFLKGKLSYHIKCSLAELQEFSKKIEKILMEVENFQCFSWNVGLAGEEFVFSLNETDSAMVKEDLASLDQQMMENFQWTEKNSFLPESILKFCQEIEYDMQREFEQCKLVRLNESCLKLNQKSKFLIASEVKDSSKRKMELAQLKHDLEWQKEELKFIIAQTKYKKNECVTKEVLLNNQISRIRTRRVSMAQELENLEFEQEKLDSQKEKIQNLITFLSKSLETILKKPQTSSECASTITSDIKLFENELKSLERQLASCSSLESDSITTKIYRLKTKISSLKSINVINSSLSSATSAKNLMSSLKKVYKFSNNCKSPCLPRSNPLNGNISTSPSKKETWSGISTLKTDRSLSVGLASHLDTNDEKYSKDEFFRKRETRLAEKEEMVEIAQERILKKIAGQDEVNSIKILKAENRRIKARLIKNEKNLENELEDMRNVKSSVIEKERELDLKLSDVDEEKWRVSQSIEDILEYLNTFINELI
jgi:hypothetical protein